MIQQTVFSLHGIRTRGAWQKSLATALSIAGFTPVPLDYGLFGALKLLLPSKRRSRVEWFRDQYTQWVRMGSSAPSIVAHSLGAYILAEALLEYPELKFDQVILCGSIASEDYPWSSIIKAGRVNRVLNDYGRKDKWARLAAWVIKDAGQSGFRGFKDDAGQRVIGRVHPTWRHSDFFYDLNYETNWIPFLKGDPLPNATALPARGINWRFALITTLLVVALVAGVRFGVNRIHPFYSPKLVLLDLVQVDPQQYALIQQLQTPPAVRQDVQGTRFDASKLFVAAIVGQEVRCGSIADNQFIPSSHPGAAMTIDGDHLEVFFIAKGNDEGFGVDGAVFVVDKRTLAPVKAVLLFASKNWGWFPRYEEPNRIVHFSYDGYFEMANTSIIGASTQAVMSDKRDQWIAAHSGGKLPAQNISDVFTPADVTRIARACKQ